MHGSIPDSHDHRDHIYKHKPISPHPDGVDLRDRCPAIYDQGHMMSCTPHAVAAAFEFEVNRQCLSPFSPSRLFIWYNARAMSGAHDAVHKNIGCQIRNAIKSLARNAQGVCSEKDWPYVVCHYNEKTLYFDKGSKARTRPPAVAYAHAHHHYAARYFRIQLKVHDMTNCLDHGYPFIIGLPTYGLLKSTTINIPDPKPKDKKNAPHRHSLLVVGYIPSRKHFIVRNSWGERAGDSGYFYMSYTFAIKEGYDAWTLRLVSKS
ncbi:cysteine proteinase [Gymnopus androsaceus JB14]|uniref:Cysteine proteinase n=1 Tax=Gymnopus androsaceus JB14 TaxID=1447944 RepID=A0A6A4H7I8_9AGAR|nr:cysteine proteinase [Gymnopus androsaceus JB14]